MTLKDLNALPVDKAVAELSVCCGSSAWQEEMKKNLPFSDESAMLQCATDIWYNKCEEQDWIEAFKHHPAIGDIKGLREKFASTSQLASAEQSGVQSATDDILKELGSLNAVYEMKFGFIFIISAAGKSAEHIVQVLRARIEHSREEELGIAMAEQHKITLKRLEKLLSNAVFKPDVSHLTTHVLDTTTGLPGRGLLIKCFRDAPGSHNAIAVGLTDEDGRVPDLFPPVFKLAPGDYHLVFDVASYFSKRNIKTFYPVIEIHFTITDNTHYHVPLLLNPFGYSTYRGS